MFAKRIADRDHKLAYGDVIGGGQWQRAHAVRQRIHLDHGEVAVSIGSDHAGGTPLAIGKDDLKRTRAFHDVIVGNDVPLIVVHKAGAAAEGGVNDVDDGGVGLRVQLDQPILQCKVTAHAGLSRVCH